MVKFNVVAWSSQLIGGVSPGVTEGAMLRGSKTGAQKKQDWSKINSLLQMNLRAHQVRGTFPLATRARNTPPQFTPIEPLKDGECEHKSHYQLHPCAKTITLSFGFLPDRRERDPQKPNTGAPLRVGRARNYLPPHS